jgi:hypothetical protein
LGLQSTIRIYIFAISKKHYFRQESSKAHLSNYHSVSAIFFNIKITCMKKFSNQMAGIALSVLITSINSCQKETAIPEETLLPDIASGANHATAKRPFKGSFGTYYNFVPDFANGWAPPNPAPAWYPGGGTGNLTHVGNCQTLFNQYATFGPGGLQSIGAPVNMFFASQLAAAGYTVPNTVTTIFFHQQGKSVWSQAVGISTTVPVSPSRVEFTASHIIIGGTKQFAGATGEYVISGFFNPQNPNEAGFSVDGWITY